MRVSFVPPNDPSEAEAPHELELVGRIFEAQYPGKCAVDWDHKVKRGDRVSRVAWADNPGIPVSGVACKNCVKIMPTAANEHI